ncbi:MAG: amidoligase family protein [Oscillospiraceae bacterium]|nr:amidoligase family protein [Oscillospiraceae bacterium]
MWASSRCIPWTSTPTRPATRTAGTISSSGSTTGIGRRWIGAGVHIHVSRKGGFQPYEIKNLVNIMAAHEQQIGKAIRIDEGRTGHYCKTVNPDFLNLMHRRNPKTMHDLENCWYEGNHANYGRTQHYNESRYHMLYVQ